MLKISYFKTTTPSQTFRNCKLSKKHIISRYHYIVVQLVDTVQSIRIFLIIDHHKLPKYLKLSKYQLAQVYLTLTIVTQACIKNLLLFMDHSDTLPKGLETVQNQFFQVGSCICLQSRNWLKISSYIQYLEDRLSNWKKTLKVSIYQGTHHNLLKYKLCQEFSSFNDHHTLAI